MGAVMAAEAHVGAAGFSGTEGDAEIVRVRPV